MWPFNRCKHSWSKWEEIQCVRWIRSGRLYSITQRRECTVCGKIETHTQYPD